MVGGGGRRWWCARVQVVEGSSGSGTGRAGRQELEEGGEAGVCAGSGKPTWGVGRPAAGEGRRDGEGMVSEGEGTPKCFGDK